MTRAPTFWMTTPAMYPQDTRTPEATACHAHERAISDGATLTATTHSLEIATNNLARPEVAIVVGANGRDLTPILQGAPNFNLQEVTYLPNSYFLQHVAHEYNGVTIQVYEEIVLNRQSAGFTITHPLHTWDPVLAVLDPALRAARERPLPMPEGSSDRFLEPIH